MPVPLFKEAKDYVVQHQEFDPVRHYYVAAHPYNQQCKLKAKTTYQLIILIAEAMQEQAKRNMRIRLLEGSNSWEA